MFVDISIRISFTSVIVYIKISILCYEDLSSKLLLYIEI